MEKQVKEKSVKQPKEKKPLSKKSKIWIALGTAFAFVVACVGTLLAVLLSAPKLKWHGLSIANFESYTGIGAASFGETAENVAYAANKGSGKKDMKLAGITKENQCREIEFEDDKGKIVKQNAHLVLFYAYEYFTFLGFSTDKHKEFVDVENMNNFSILEADTNEYYIHNDKFDLGEDCFLFILDNKTGKIYDIRDIMSAIKKFFDVDYIQANLSNLANSPIVLGEVTREFFNQETLMFVVEGRRYDSSNIIKNLVKINFDENDVKVVETMNSIQLKNFTNYPEENIYDKYGNVFTKYSTWQKRYQKTDGTFAIIPNNGQYKFGFNNIVYLKENEKTFYLNRKGEFEEIDFDYDSIFEKIYFCEKRDNVVYGMLYESTVSLIKITFDEELDWKYTVEKEPINVDVSYKAEIIGKYVVLLSNNQIKIYNMETKTLTDFESNSNYRFKEIKNYQSSNIIKFKAFDKLSMLDVEGYIDENGKVHLGSFAGRNYGHNNVYVIKPIN